MLPVMDGSLGLGNRPSTVPHSNKQRSLSSLRPRVQLDDLRSVSSTVNIVLTQTNISLGLLKTLKSNLFVGLAHRILTHE